MESQNQLIRQHLESGKSITPLEALSMYGCLRLGARIYDLRQDGLPVKTEIKRNGKKWFAKYSLLNKRHENKN
jgi:hypothetical protein